MTRQAAELRDAHRALAKALEALDAEAGTNPAVIAVHQAADRFHAAVRMAGGRAPMFNVVRGLAESHLAAALGTVSAEVRWGLGDG